MMYNIMEEGYTFNQVEANSAEEALNKAEELVGTPDYSLYNIDNYPARITWWAVAVENDEDRAHRDYYIDAVEPVCLEDEHNWRERECRGQGGGVLVTEVCKHCGWTRYTDTWHQDPRDGSVWGCDYVYYEKE